MGLPNHPWAGKYLFLARLHLLKSKRPWRLRQLVHHEGIVPKVMPRSQVIFLLLKKISGQPWNRKCCDVEFAHASEVIYSFHSPRNHLHNARGSIRGRTGRYFFKNNLRGIALGVTPKWRMNSYTLLPFERTKFPTTWPRLSNKAFPD